VSVNSNALEHSAYVLKYMKNTVFWIVTLRREADASETQVLHVKARRVRQARNRQKQAASRATSLSPTYAASLLCYVLFSTFPYAHILLQIALERIIMPLKINRKPLQSLHKIS
jgi:energy-coupling factor transporter transmembrane protein EcfT